MLPQRLGLGEAEQGRHPFHGDPPFHAAVPVSRHRTAHSFHPIKSSGRRTFNNSPPLTLRPPERYRVPPTYRPASDGLHLPVFLHATEPHIDPSLLYATGLTDR